SKSRDNKVKNDENFKLFNKNNNRISSNSSVDTESWSRNTNNRKK
ncbi:unnamed protein product, partial [marine sediment metagenome]